MAMKTPREIASVVGASAAIGMTAGLRSMTPLAVTAVALQQRWAAGPNFVPQKLRQKPSAATFSALAAGEMVADKFPQIPNRTDAPSLAFRCVTGALSAAILFAPNRRLLLPAAAAGAAASVAGAHLGYRLRKGLSKSLEVSDAVVGLAEDALTASCALLLARNAWRVAR